MRPPLPIRGHVASITWHYYTAAALEAYTVTFDRERRQWTVVATVVHADAYKMTQRPLVLVATIKDGAWRWPVLEARVENGRLLATLGAPLP